MPPQQNLTPGIGRDAARLRLVFVKDAAGDAVAEACPDASIAARRDAFSEKQAAGPPVASTWSVLGLLGRCWRAFQKRRQRVSLRDLSERELMDIGLTQGDIDCIVAGRAIERLRDRTTYLWLTRGMM